MTEKFRHVFLCELGYAHKNGTTTNVGTTFILQEIEKDNT